MILAFNLNDVNVIPGHTCANTEFQTRAKEQQGTKGNVVRLYFQAYKF